MYKLFSVNVYGKQHKNERSLDWMESSLALMEVEYSLTPSRQQTSPLGNYATCEIDHGQGVL